MFSELFSDISFRQSCWRTYFHCQCEPASQIIKITTKVRILSHGRFTQTFQEGKLNFFFYIGILTGSQLWRKKFLEETFLIHALFSFIFESKHKINVHLRSLMNICLRRKKRLAFTCHAKQTRKLEIKTLKI